MANEEIQRKTYIKVPLKNILNVNRIVTLYYFDFSPTYSSCAEAHDFWEIVYIDSGELDLQGGEKTYHLRQGEIIFHRPNEIHSIRCDGTHAASVFIITFACSSPAMRFFYEKTMSVPRELDGLWHQLIRECTQSFHLSVYPLRQKTDAPIGGLQLIRNYLECFLISLMRSEEKSDRINLLFTSQDNLEGKLAKDLHEYLKAHLCGRITLEELSEHFHFGVSTLCSAFRKNTGQTILHCFLDMKITEAKRLLQEENMTVSEISECLSFESPQYFSRMFRKYVGVSPRDFRNRLIKSADVYVWKK